MEKESISEIYFERLSQTSNPGPILAKFLCELLGLQISKSHIIMMNKLIRIFGRFTVFFSIIDVAFSEVSEENLYAYLYRGCKRRFEASHEASLLTPLESLSKAIQAVEREIKAVKRSKLKIPDPENLEKER